MKTCTKCGESKPREAFSRHGSRPDGLSNACKPCECARAVTYRATNVETVRAGRAAYREANRGTLRAKDAAYREANRDKVRAKDAAWRAANRDKVRAKDAVYRGANAARTLAEVEAARARLRPDGLKKCRRCHERLTLDAFAGNATAADGLGKECRSCASAGLLRIALPYWESIGLDPSRCIYNATECTGLTEAVDHVIPQALEGTDDPRNLRPACTPCNSSKWAAPVTEWIDRIHPGLRQRLGGCA